MDNYTSYEQAYKNGYAAGFKAASDEFKPRVLSVEELCNAECAWLEMPHKWPSALESWVFFLRCSDDDAIFLFFGMEESDCLPLIDYGKSWRVWNQKPSNILKMHTPWDH